MADFWDQILDKIGGTAGRQVTQAGTGATGDLIDWFMQDLLGLNVGVGNYNGSGTGYTGKTGEGTNVAAELVDMYRDFPLYDVTYDPVNASTYSASQIGSIDPITGTYVNDSPEMRAKLLDVMGNLEGQMTDGISEQDRMMLNTNRADQAQRAANSDAAVLADLAKRGQLGGLEEILTRQTGRESAAREANRTGIELARQAAERRNQAARDLSSLAASTRAADINLSGKNADIANTTAQTNAARDLQRMLANQTSANQAGQFNAAQQNQVNQNNAENAMRSQQYNNTNELQRMAGTGAAYRNLQDQLNAEEAAAARRAYAEAVMSGQYGGLGGFNLPNTGTGTGTNPYGGIFGTGGIGGSTGTTGGSNSNSGGLLDWIGGGIKSGAGDVWDWLTGSEIDTGIDWNNLPIGSFPGEEGFSDWGDWGVSDNLPPSSWDFGDWGSIGSDNLPPSSWDWDLGGGTDWNFDFDTGGDFGGYFGGDFDLGDMGNTWTDPFAGGTEIADSGDWLSDIGDWFTGLFG